MAQVTGTGSYYSSETATFGYGTPGSSTYEGEYTGDDDSSHGWSYYLNKGFDALLLWLTSSKINGKVGGVSVSNPGLPQTIVDAQNQKNLVYLVIAAVIIIVLIK